VSLPVIEYFQKLPVEFARNTRNPEVVHDEKPSPCEPFKQRGQALRLSRKIVLDILAAIPYFFADAIRVVDSTDPGPA
jgi:hypothetical protein